MSTTVFLTGATGYIGGRLLRRFEEGGRPVRCLVRNTSRLASHAPTTELVQGDVLDEAVLDAALGGIETAYYLIHSMGAGGDFEATDRRAAECFGRAAHRAGVRRIIYLGGLTDESGPVSAHLKSRAETGDILRASSVPVVELRASIVIGAGSLSLEMIAALVERLPVMVCPRWVSTLTQPIAADDVLSYLEAAANLPDRGSETFEIGGPEVMSYGDLMRAYARLRGLRRWLIPVPLLTPRLSGWWLALVTPAQARVGRALVEGLKNSTVVRSTLARERFDVVPRPLSTALTDAIENGTAARMFTDTRVALVDVPPAQAFGPIRRIGGSAGYYFGNALWRVRGAIDRCAGGRRISWTRRDPETCVPGDAIDGWTVEAFEPDRLLRLAATFRLPGRGWLEFEVTPGPDRFSKIRQTASFDPRGVLGRMYWYGILPLHGLMFGGMLAQIAKRARRPATSK
ncbi:MAG: SDR family oxidoreductase [Vicinamibacterales bacterium]